jgi:hypothetical protein
MGRGPRSGWVSCRGRDGGEGVRGGCGRIWRMRVAVRRASSPPPAFLLVPRGEGENCGSCTKVSPSPVRGRQPRVPTGCVRERGPGGEGPAGSRRTSPLPLREGCAPAGPRPRSGRHSSIVPAAQGARRRWQRLYRCLRRAQPGPERSGGTRPNPAVLPGKHEAPPRNRRRASNRNESNRTSRASRTSAEHEDQAPPMSLAMTAFCTCSRFSASSHTRLRGPSSTPSLTSSPRCAGRQCRKMERAEAVSIISSVMQ